MIQHPFLQMNLWLGKRMMYWAVKKLLLHPEMAGDTENWIIGIVGMGGSGKTTLAKTICNEPDVMAHFDCIYHGDHLPSTRHTEVPTTDLERFGW